MWLVIGYNSPENFAYISSEDWIPCTLEFITKQLHEAQNLTPSNRTLFSLVNLAILLPSYFEGDENNPEYEKLADFILDEYNSIARSLDLPIVTYALEPFDLDIDEHQLENMVPLIIEPELALNPTTGSKRKRKGNLPIPEKEVQSTWTVILTRKAIKALNKFDVNGLKVWGKIMEQLANDPLTVLGKKQQKENASEIRIGMNYRAFAVLNSETQTIIIERMGPTEGFWKK